MDVVTAIWIIAGVVLILLEFVIPGFIIIFMGTSALIVGLAVWAGLPGDGALAIGLFGALCVLQIVLLRRQFQRWFRGNTVVEDSSEVGDWIDGAEAKVIDGLAEAGARGHVECRGSRWNAITDAPMKPGDIVRIVSRDGLTVHVAPLD